MRGAWESHTETLVLSPPLGPSLERGQLGWSLHEGVTLVVSRAWEPRS